MMPIGGIKDVIAALRGLLDELERRSRADTLPLNRRKISPIKMRRAPSTALFWAGFYAGTGVGRTASKHLRGHVRSSNEPGVSG